MAKKATTRKSHPKPAWAANLLTDPADIFEHIEDESMGPDDTDPYLMRVQQLMSEAIEASPNPDARQDIEAMRELFHGHVFEEVARKTGFILGFEYCRALLGGSAKKGGAR
jgi:hypothetical protein